MKPSARLRRLHFVGIGGAGMSALAETLLGFGFVIRGSDRSDSAAARRLRSLGVTVFTGHDAAQLDPGCDAAVYSAAVDPENPELQAARARGVPVVRRADLLGLVMARGHGLAVAGTHGKTTTTGMLIHILCAAGNDPTWVAGGTWQGGASGHAGRGECVIAEADEYDRAFLSLRPASAIVTNIDADHLDVYGSLAAVGDAFAVFLRTLPFFGTAVVNAEDPGVQSIQSHLTGRIRTFGFDQGDYQARRLETSAAGTRFTLYQSERELGAVRLRVVGRHNAANALAAAALALEEGCGFDAVAAGLESFPGMLRRLERIGARRNIAVFDDYAHHPAEILAALQAARLFTTGRLCVLFQPHLYSRTRQLLPEFARALQLSDCLFVLPVYAARESASEGMPGVDGDALVAEAKRLGHVAAMFLPDRETAARTVAQRLRPDDVCVTMGAGDVGELAPAILEALA